LSEHVLLTVQVFLLVVEGLPATVTLLPTVPVIVFAFSVTDVVPKTA
jgi:hypothetical protein